MIKIDVLPTNWEGFAYLNEPLPSKGSEAETKDFVPEDIDDKPVDLSSLPF